MAPCAASADHLAVLSRVGFWVGAGACVLMQGLPEPGGLSAGAWDAASLAILMGVWWFTEAVPIPLTGSLPFLLLPIFGVQSAAEVSANYMSPVHFLIMGGAMLGLATEKWGLHRRLALLLLTRVRPTPRRVVFAVMLATAIISMVVSNSATTIMMLPIAAAILASVDARDPQAGGATAALGCALYIGIAVASNMGGFVTPVGTPVNPVIIELVSRILSINISFLQWMAFALPLIVVALPLAWLAITHELRRVEGLDMSGGFLADATAREALKVPEKRTLLVVIATSGAWVCLPLFGELPGISAATVAMCSALALCVLPSGARESGVASQRLLEWSDCARAPWFLVFLLGGGLALADAVVVTGLSDWMGDRLRRLAELPLPLLFAAVALICVAVTECASQVGTATTFMPIVAALAISGGIDPLPTALAAGLAASWGMANPAGTSSNAMVIASGKVPVPRFVALGLMIDLLGVVLLTFTCLVLVPLVF